MKVIQTRQLVYMAHVTSRKGLQSLCLTDNAENIKKDNKMKYANSLHMKYANSLHSHTERGIALSPSELLDHM